MNSRHFKTLPLWADATAERIAAILKDDIERHGRSVLAVPGGRTARAVLPVLAQQVDLEWTKITVTLVDERWVDAVHPDSNERLARSALAPVLDRATFIGLYTGHATPEDGLAAATKRIDALGPLGCVLLGMGEDGHIASVFPGDAPQNATLQTARREDHPRITMSPRTMLNAHGVVVALSGAQKCAVLKRALIPGPAVNIPLRHVLHQDRTPVFVFTA